MIDLKPVTLHGTAVRLEPLDPRHFDELCDVGLDPEMWRWLMVEIKSREDLKAWLREAIAAQGNGLALPFAIIEKTSGRAIGTTRFANIELQHSRVEIGWTWIAPAWQRTIVNTETKYLLLRHAFESLGFRRVEFKTDALNKRSRAALRRIGATEEGTLRRHMVASNGRVRDSVYFSIVDTEWAEAKQALEALLRFKS